MGGEGGEGGGGARIRGSQVVFLINKHFSLLVSHRKPYFSRHLLLLRVYFNTYP